MINYKLTSRAITITGGSSAGTQRKYYDDGYWYKCNQNGYEGIAEELCSKVLECSNIDCFVSYERCTINDNNGCRSKNFLKADEGFLSVNKLFILATGKDLNNEIRKIEDVSDRIFYVIEFVENQIGFDISDYLADILLLDAFVLNDDRHFNNLGIIINENTGEIRRTPIFDNGASLFSDFRKYPFDEDYESNLSHVAMQPFSASLSAQALVLPSKLKVDYSALHKILDEYQDCRAKETLLRQMNVWKDILSLN